MDNIEEENINTIQKDVLQKVLRLSVVFGTALFLWVTANRLPQGDYGHVGLYIVCYATFLYVAFNPKNSHRVRSNILIGVMVVITLQEYVLYGMAGDAEFFLMSTVALVTVFVSKRAGYFSVGVAFLILIAVAALRVTGSLNALPIQYLENETFADWVPTLIESVLFCGGLAYLVGTLLEKLVQGMSEREDSLQAARESEEKFRMVDEQSMLSVVIIQEGRAVHFNQAARDLFEFSQEEIDSWGDVSRGGPEERWHPDDREFVLDQMRKKQAGETEGVVPNYSYRIITTTGKIRWIEQFSKTIQYNDKPAVIVSMIDITEKKIAEEEKAVIENQFNQAQKVEAVGRLAGGVAHDINNLLTPILGYGDLLLLDTDLNKDSREYVEQIVYASNGARDLIHQLLAFSRKREIKKKIFQINQFIEDFTSLIQLSLKEEIEFEFRPGSDLPPVFGGMSQIEQITMNLLMNAQDAMPNGGKIVLETDSVEFSNGTTAPQPGLSPGSYVVIRITDTGAGIPEDIQQEIFDPFFSTKGEKGTGLGLATVLGIVQQHDGAISVDSQIGKGSTFTIYLPAATGKVVPGETKVDGRTPSQSDIHRKTVLVAEDEEQVRNLAHAMLTQLGFKVLLASDGPEALDLLDAYEDDVELLLTDVVMPKMNGKDLAAKAMLKKPNLKLVFMSGYTDDIVPDEEGFNEGVGFIQKPFSLKSLSELIHKVLTEEAPTTG
jgi:PAS domain S-box-containing protein